VLDCSHASPKQAEMNPSRSCAAAGVSRAAFRDPQALQWLSEENAKRAPYYIKQARLLYNKAVRQLIGEDKSNSDPFIASYDGQHQVLAALDLAPNNASIWIGAGQAMALFASISEDKERKMREALALFKRACALDAGSVDKILDWSSGKEANEREEVKGSKAIIRKAVKKWRNGNLAKSPMPKFLSFLSEREDAEACPSGASMEPTQLNKSEQKTASSEELIKGALASMTVRPVFPTLITSVNVRSHLGDEFSKTLGKIAVKKYRAFSKKAKAAGQTNPNDINDAFFSQQFTGEDAHLDPRALQMWPELYSTKEYQLLSSFMRRALYEHAAKTGYPVSEKAIKDTYVVMWSAVYLSDGGRHSYHVHQSCLVSCVFYAMSPPGKTPIMFIDPRGAPPTHDYEQHEGERDFEPMAPFHHNYNFFAESGDLVCFPSWLVHRVPSHFEKQPRVAFAANLQVKSSWDSWYRSASLA